jgi:hypothetical protein
MDKHSQNVPVQEVLLCHTNYCIAVTKPILIHNEVVR